MFLFNKQRAVLLLAEMRNGRMVLEVVIGENHPLLFTIDRTSFKRPATPRMIEAARANGRRGGRKICEVPQ